MLKIKDMSYTYEGQLSTDKDDRKFGHILEHMLMIPFPVLAGTKINSSQKQEMELKLIPAQTGNGTMKMYTNCEINSSVDS